MTPDLSRLFHPKTIAVVGGGAWCKSAITQLIKSDFTGAIWPVHPSAAHINGLKAVKSITDLPTAPDATFIGVNRDTTIDIVAQLSAMGAGGAVCFASGFGETQTGSAANENLLTAAASMPVLGPNCYGFINALDGVSLWPDQHGCRPVDRGVALLTQSSNIAINLTMQKRGLPIAYVVTCGNQAQLSEAAIANALLDDPRVTAIGLHIEGFGDLPEWQTFARRAHAKGIPVVALKVGKSVQARAATISHTASLAGSDAGAQALLDHLGIARVSDLPTLLETLKLLHCGGPLASRRIASISCSGGEASLIADMAANTPLIFPPLNTAQHARLENALGPKVALANPLDYHTYIWRDVPAMTAAFSAMIDTEIALTLLIVDFPRSDMCDPTDWDCVVAAALATATNTSGRIAMVATLPELMPEDIAAQLMAGGVTPFNGLAEALAAITAAQILAPSPENLVLPPAEKTAIVLDEHTSKTHLKDHGLRVPKAIYGDLDSILTNFHTLTPPFALKITGIAHKSETGGVTLHLTTQDDIETAAKKMASSTFILEEMVTNPVAELIVGIVKDPAHGFVITLGAGGILTELLQDITSVLIPTSREKLSLALSSLKISALLNGYRGAPATNLDSILDAVLALQSYVLANIDTVEEIEVNPLIATATHAIAADALIRKSHDTD